MKKALILLLFACGVSASHAQTFSEWFRQKKTQRKYLNQQIAALQAYLGYLHKGYSIVQKGLYTLSDLKQGELNLHTDYFHSLKLVNPEIEGYERVAQIIVLEKNILQDCKRAHSEIKGSLSFTPAEVRYTNRVFNRLLNDCSEVMDELLHLTTDGKLEMSDDERMERMDKLCNRMQDNYSFLKSFGSEAMLLAVARSKEHHTIQTSRAFLGIKNQ